MAASESSTERAPEFTAVILAGGKANSLYPLTEDIPLSLLPVANRPLISFQLEMLARVGFRCTCVAGDALAGGCWCISACALAGAASVCSVRLPCYFVIITTTASGLARLAVDSGHCRRQQGPAEACAELHRSPARAEYDDGVSRACGRRDWLGGCFEGDWRPNQGSL